MEVTGKEGEDLKISCTICGTPEPEIIWFRDKKPLKDDYRVDIYNDRGVRYLEICDVQTNDSGEYTIFLRNSVNQIHAVTKVIINENLTRVKKSRTEGLFLYESKFVDILLTVFLYLFIFSL